jgi:hypothetical protein
VTPNEADARPFLSEVTVVPLADNVGSPKTDGAPLGTVPAGSQAGLQRGCHGSRALSSPLACKGPAIGDLVPAEEVIEDGTLEDLFFRF